MRDFSLSAYAEYLSAIQGSYPVILRFDEFFAMDARPDQFCLIRHDVDRKPGNALRMAELEHRMDIPATYYFRAKRHTFKPEIINKIAAMGHEIGYHYECLSDTNGDMVEALKDFETNLQRFRDITEIKTISMHGQPLKPIDNRDLWRESGNHRMLQTRFQIAGEVYLDIDYREIAYVNDTGRNWTANENNVRDKVRSTVRLDAENGEELLAILRNNPPGKMIFQIHPERWEENPVSWYIQSLKDQGLNLAKKLIRRYWSAAG